MKTVSASLIIFPTQRPRLFVSVLLGLLLLVWMLTAPALAAAQDFEITPEATATLSARVGELPDSIFDEPTLPVPTEALPPPEFLENLFRLLNAVS